MQQCLVLLMISNRHNLAFRLQDCPVYNKERTMQPHGGTDASELSNFTHYLDDSFLQPSPGATQKFQDSQHLLAGKHSLIMSCVLAAKRQLISSGVEAKTFPQQNIIQFLLKQYYCQIVTFSCLYFMSLGSFQQNREKVWLCISLSVRRLKLLRLRLMLSFMWSHKDHHHMPQHLSQSY